MRTAARIVAGVSFAALALAGCSDGDGDGAVPASTYAQRLCASMQTYIDDVTTLSTDFAAGIDPAGSLETQKAAVLGFLDDVLAATDRLIAGVGRAGVPDVGGGQEIVVAIEETFEEARGVLEEAEARVQAIPVDDPEAFATQLNEVGATIQTSLGEIGGSLASIDAPELTAAVRDEPACAAVAGAARG